MTSTNSITVSVLATGSWRVAPRPFNPLPVHTVNEAGECVNLENLPGMNVRVVVMLRSTFVICEISNDDQRIGETYRREIWERFLVECF